MTSLYFGLNWKMYAGAEGSCELSKTVPYREINEQKCVFLWCTDNLYKVSTYVLNIAGF